MQRGPATAKPPPAMRRILSSDTIKVWKTRRAEEGGSPSPTSALLLSELVRCNERLPGSFSVRDSSLVLIASNKRC